MKRGLITLLVLLSVSLAGCLSADQAKNETLREIIANLSFQPGPNPPQGCGNGILDLGEQCERGIACPAGETCVGCLCATPDPGGPGGGPGAGPGGSGPVGEVEERLRQLEAENEQVVADLLDILSRLDAGYTPKDEDLQLVREHLGQEILDDAALREETLENERRAIIAADECYVISGVKSSGCGERSCSADGRSVITPICDTSGDAKAEKEHYLAKIGRCIDRIDTCISTESCADDNGVYCRGDPCQNSADCPASFCEDGKNRAPRCSTLTSVGTYLDQSYCMHSPHGRC